nr:MarR family transcriptional regulator [Staphylococcus massiliensis]
MSYTCKQIFSTIKKEHQLTYEEVFILEYVYYGEKKKYDMKEITKAANLKPYYITKALQKLKDMNLVSKKRNLKDERTVIIEISKTQREKIKKIIDQIESYLVFE